MWLGFKAYEMAPLAAVRPAELQRTLTPIADNAIEYGERTRELEAKWAAQRQAAQDEHTTPQTAAAALRAAIAGPSVPLPLNRAGILRAALGGGRGTINGDGQ